MALIARAETHLEPAESKKTRPEKDALLSWLKVLVGDAPRGLVELRAGGVTRHNSTARHTESSIFASDEPGLKKLAAEARELSRRCEAVWTTLNPIASKHVVGSGSASDHWISSRRWFLVDCDPVRPAGTSSTDAEKAAALARAKQVRDYLRSEGWPDPVLADSGNGYHLLYRIDLPADDVFERRDGNTVKLSNGPTTEVIRKTLQHLADRFDDDQVKVDRSVYNASRVCKLYGTWTRKGEDSPDRPHRLSALVEVPSKLQAVGIEWFVHLANQVDTKKAPGTNGNGKPRKRGLVARDLGDDPVTAYSNAALVEELNKLASAGEGHRNHQLFKSAAALYQLVAAGSLDEHDVRSGLEATARQIGLGDDEARKTIDSARRAGSATPRDLTSVGKKTEKAVVVTDPETGRTDPADDPHRLAAAFLKTCHRHADGPTLRWWNEEWHAWDGRWRATSDRELNGRLASFCKEEFARLGLDKAVGTRLIGNVSLALRGMVLIPLATVPEQPAWIDGDGPDPSECLPTQSGIVHLPTLLAEGPNHPEAVLPATPRFFSPNLLSYAFDPNPPRPDAWLSFLNGLWPDDPESIRALQQWFGYLITADTSRQKILLLIGPRRSGKGTITRTLRALVGEANVAAPTLGTLATQFGCQSLIGKTLAVVPESRLSGRSDSQAIVERLLSISGEDPQTIDRKHLTAWTGVLRSRFVLLGNELPRLGDYSGALPSRMIVLKMTESFLGREDRHLGDKILAELPGILVWAIAGWHDLRQSGTFLQPATGRELLDEFETLTNPIGAFLAESCTLDPSLRTPVPRLYDAWKAWCETNGRDHPGDVQGFCRSLRAAISTLQVTQPRVNGGRVRMLVGIGLNQGENDAF